MALPPILVAIAFSQCLLQASGTAFKGSCGKLFDQTPSITLARETAITTGVWRKGAAPISTWRGEMTDESYGKVPIELEIYAGGWGILRTIYAWIPVTKFNVSSGLSFRVDASGEVAPGVLDREIVRRASAILSRESQWNRNDNRVCPPGATTWSIYCALERATIELTGAFSHRRPALEVVRILVDQRSAGRHYNHRLMDWNNDPRTDFSDVRTLFAEALQKMTDAKWLSARGFVPAPFDRLSFETHAARAPQDDTQLRLVGKAL